MPADIWIQSTALTGANLYAVIDRLGQRWNGTAFEAVTASHWASYAVPLVEAAGTGFFRADVPSGLGPGYAVVTIFRRAGSSPATADREVGDDGFWWTGVAAARLDGSVAGITGAVAALQIEPGVSLVRAIQCMASQSVGVPTVTGDTVVYAGIGVSTPRVRAVMGPHGRTSVVLL